MNTPRALLIALLLVLSSFAVPGAAAGPGHCDDREHGNGNGHNRDCDADGGNCGNGQGQGQGANNGQGGNCDDDGDLEESDPDDPDNETDDDTPDPNGGGGDPVDGESGTGKLTAFSLGGDGKCDARAGFDPDTPRVAVNACVLAPRDRDADWITSLWTYRVRVEVGPNGGELVRGHQEESGLGPDPDDQHSAGVVPRSL